MSWENDRMFAGVFSIRQTRSSGLLEITQGEEWFIIASEQASEQACVLRRCMCSYDIWLVAKSVEWIDVGRQAGRHAGRQAQHLKPP